MITADGIEGGAVYALSAPLRDAIDARRADLLHVDLRPDLTLGGLARRLDGPRGSESLSNFLRKAAGLPPVAVGLVQEALHAGAEAGNLAALIKAVPVRLTGAHRLARAISTAGGRRLDELDARLCCAAGPACSPPAKCWTGRRRPAAICCKPASAPGAAAGQGVLALAGGARMSMRRKLIAS